MLEYLGHADTSIEKQYSLRHRFTVEALVA